MPVVPTIFTLINAMLGFISVLYSVKFAIYHGTIPTTHFLQKAAWLIMAAIIFDAFDGEVARFLKQASNFGAELDSLSDALSFGVAPGVLVFVWAHISFREIGFPGVYSRMLYIVLTLFVLAVIIRLARFNVETPLEKEYHKFFKGLPSPAGGGFLASLVILQLGLVNSDSFVYQTFGRFLSDTSIDTFNRFLYWALPFFTLILAFLMVSTISYPHALQTILGDRPKVQYFLYIFTILGLLWIIREISVFLFFVAYVLLGPLVAYLRLKSAGT